MVTVVDKMHLYYRCSSLCADCLLPVVERKWSLDISEMCAYLL